MIKSPCGSIISCTQTDMPVTWRKLRSKIRWLTDSCKSHYISHFTAFFIVARAKRSIVKSCLIKFSIIYSVKQYKREWDTELALRPYVQRGERESSGFPLHSPSLQPNWFVNDPSAGSPTETLLRLLLPLNDQVCPISHQASSLPNTQDPKASLSHSIGSSDGRCVQRAGT